MHEVKLGFKLRDYLSGKEIDATTYEDLRQEIVKMMVEEKGYPKGEIRSKETITITIGERDFSRIVDFVVYKEGSPFSIVMFCAGEIETYVRECISMGRLLSPQPAIFGIVTDTQQYILLDIKSGEVIDKKAYKDFIPWDRLEEMGQSRERISLTPEKRAKEERIFYALSQLSCECRDTCNM